MKTRGGTMGKKYVNTWLIGGLVILAGIGVAIEQAEAGVRPQSGVYLFLDGWIIVLGNQLWARLKRAWRRQD